MTTATLLHQVLTAFLAHTITADSVAIPILQRLTSVRIHNSAAIGLPDTVPAQHRGQGDETRCGTVRLKWGVQLDVLTGTLCGLDLIDERGS